MTPDPGKRGVEPVDDLRDGVGRFHRVLVESIAVRAPAYLRESFTVAEIYQALAPFRSQRDRLGLTLKRDYDDILLRLLAGEGEYVVLESEPARERIQRELGSRSPNTGIYREFAAAKAHLNPRHLPADLRDPPLPEPPATGGDTSGIGAGENASRDPGPEAVVAACGTGPAFARDACPACGGDLPHHEKLKFCPYCGANTREAPCPKCGEILSREWRFCIACGARALP